MMNFRDDISLRLISRFPALKDVLYPRLKPSFRCKTHLTSAELVALYRLASNKVNALEIGSYLGASACAISAALDPRKGRLFCVDTWENNAMSEGMMDTYLEFKSNTTNFSHLLNPLRGWSHLVVDQVCDLTDSLDLLFIDGDHSYEGAKKDWDTYKKLLRKGSVVVFHDFGWATGVQKLVTDEVRSVTVTHGSLPNMWWGVVDKET